MFKKLKSQMQEAVNERVIKPLTGSPQSNQTENYASSNAGRSRTNSFSSVASDSTQFLFTNYSTPNRTYYPPSDLESELDESVNFDSSPNNDVKRLNKLVSVYKNKFNQLKEAYTEVEAEKEKIKKILTDSQDKVLKRVQDLKSQIEIDKNLRKDQEFQFKMQLNDKDDLINSLKAKLDSTSSVSTTEKLIDIDATTTNQEATQPQQSPISEANNETKEKIKKLETLLARCKDLIKTQKEQILEKETEINKLKDDSIKNDSNTTKLKEVELNFDRVQKELNSKTEQTLSQQASIDKLQKRCNDLNYELEEKGSLFQKQFQLFQAEFVQKEDNLLLKIKNLQEELDYEKTKSNKFKSEIEHLKAKTIENDEIKNDLELKLDLLNKEKLNLKTEFDATNSKNQLNITELNAKLNDLLNENHSTELKELNNQLESFKLKLTEETDEKQRLAELLKAKETKNGNEKKLNKLKEKHSTELDEKQNEFDQKMQSLQNENQLHVLTIHNLNQSKNNEIETFEKEILTLKSQCSDLEIQLKTKSEDSSIVEDLKQKLQDLTTINAQILTKIDGLNNETEESETIKSTLENQIDQLNNQLKTSSEVVSNQTNDFKKQIKDLKAKLTHSESIKTDLETKLSEKIIELNQLVIELKSKSGELETKQNQIKELKSANNQLEAETEAKLSYLHRQIDQLQSAEKSIEELKSQLNTQNDKLNESSTNFSNLQNELYANQSLTDNLKQELEALKTKAAKNTKNDSKSLNLNKQIEELKSKLEEIIKAKSDIEAQYELKIDYLNKEINDLNSQIKTESKNKLKKQIEELNSQVKTLTVTKSDSETQLKEGQSTIHNLNKKLEELNDSTNKTDTKEIEELNSKLEKEFQLKRDEYETKIKILNQKIQDLNVQLSEQESKSNESRLLNEELNLKNSDLELAKNVLEKESIGYQTTITDLNKICEESISLTKELEEKQAELKLEIEQINLVKANLETKSNEDQSIISDLTKRLEDLNAQLSNKNEINSQITQLKKQIEDLNLNKPIFESKIESLDKQVEELDSKLKDSSTKVSNLENEMKQKSAQNQSLAEKLNEAETININLRAELNTEKIANKSTDLKKQIEDLISNLNCSNLEKAELETQLSIKNKELKSIADKSNEYKLTIENLTNQIEALNSKLQGLTTTNTQIMSKSDEYKLKIDTLNNEIETFEKEILSLKSQCSDLEIQLKTKSEDNSIGEDLKQKLQDLTTINAQMLTKIDSLNNETEELKLKLKESETIKSTLENQIDQLNNQLKTSSEVVSNQTNDFKKQIKDLKAKLTHSESIKTDLETKLSEKIIELNQLVIELKSKSEQIEQLKKETKRVSNESEAKLNTVHRQIDELKTQLANQLENANSKQKQIDDLNSECEKYEALKIELSKQNNLKSDEIYTKVQQIEQLIKDNINLKEFNSNLNSQITKLTNDLSDKQTELNNIQIDLTTSKTKLNENLTDYKSSIEKVKQANNQVKSKLKKKLANCITALNLIDKNLIQIISSEPLQFINNINEEDFELDESNLKQLIEAKKNLIENNFKQINKLNDYNKLEENIKIANENLQKSANETLGYKSKIEQLEQTHSIEKEKLNTEYQRNTDDLSLKLANLDLKYKQIQLEDNKESHSLKRKITQIDEEILKLKKENEQLNQQLKLGQEKNDKSLQQIKQKSDLKIASIKKQFENEQSTKLDELNSKIYELELQLKEKIKLIELLKSDCETLSTKLNIIEVDFGKKITDETSKNKQLLDAKDKQHNLIILDFEQKYHLKQESLNQEIQQLRNKLNDIENKHLKDQNIKQIEQLSNRQSKTLESDLSRLKTENLNLNKQLEEMKISYDELKDEKTQLYLSLNDLKQQQSDLNLFKPKQIDTNDTFLKYIDKKQKQFNAPHEDSLSYLNNYKIPSNSDRSLMTEFISDHESQNSSHNLSSMCLEPTEIDYLRQIVYSYMMGTDPITMAKVIVAVLKFPEDERRKIIENEKTKYSGAFGQKWFSSLAQ